MWNDKTVLSKSELGRNAIAQRLPVLPVRLRPVLILVDGKRTFIELGRLLEGLGGTFALKELGALGMVEAHEASSAEAGDSALPAPVAPPVADSAGVTFADYVRAVGVYFDRELGPNGQILVLQIGAASDMKTLKPLIDRGLDNLKYFKGPGAVADFKATLGQKGLRI